VSSSERPEKSEGEEVAAGSRLLSTERKRKTAIDEVQKKEAREEVVVKEL